jgi:hypothetical protein
MVRRAVEMRVSNHSTSEKRVKTAAPRDVSNLGMESWIEGSAAPPGDRVKPLIVKPCSESAVRRSDKEP